MQISRVTDPAQSGPVQRNRAPQSIGRVKEPRASTGRALPTDDVSLGQAPSAGGVDGPSPTTTTRKGPAHGVVRLLAAGHFKGNAEAVLMARFGHLLSESDESDSDEIPVDDSSTGEASAPVLADEVSPNVQDSPPMLGDPVNFNPISITGIRIDLLA